MNTYLVKGKVTCFSRKDRSVIASWFKELSLEAASESEAISKAEQLIAQEYDDADVAHSSDLQAKLTGSAQQPTPPPPSPSLGQPPAPPATKDEKDFRFRI